MLLPLKGKLSYIPAYAIFYYCDKNREVAGAILYNAIGIFHSHNPSGHTMALGSTQSLTRDTFWGVKAAGT